MGGTSDETSLETMEVPKAPTPKSVTVPEYDRKKVDEIIDLIRDAASASADRPNVEQVQLELSRNDLLILDDMLREMDRHLPDFFEG